MAETAIAWTLAELDRLPDDGNTYELIDGELFVTPAPSPAHEELAYLLRMLLEPYVRLHGLGKVQTPRAAIRIGESEVEPDLMVRPLTASVPLTWRDAPIPLLVVEIASRTTYQRDREQKRRFYMRSGVATYWIVDRWSRTIHVIQHGHADIAATETLTWHPAGALELLSIDVTAYFAEAMGAL